MLNNINDLLLVAKQQEGGYEPYGETLEYVNLNGTQYFDTEIAPNPNLKIDVTFRTTDSNLTQNRCVFGGRIAVSGSDRKATAFWNIVSASGGYMRADYGNLSTGTSDIGISSSTIDTWTNIVIDKDKVYLNGTLKYTFSNPFVAGTDPCSIIIGGMRSGRSFSSSTANFFIGDIQQAKIWDNDVLIRDYVPKLDIQLRPCLYDKVSKTFLYAKSSSDGTTTYDLGFKRWNKFDVDYIQSDGNQYIDTGYNINENTVIKFRAKSTDTTQYNNTLTGCGTNSSSTDRVQCHLGTGSVGSGGKVTIRIDGTMSSASTAPTIDDKWFTGEINIPDKKAYINDTEIISSFSGSYIKTIPVAIFGRMISDSSTLGYDIDTGYLAKAGLAEYQFIENNVVVRNFKPSVWHNGDSTAEACLYDEVYNKMYPNAGTGSFKAYIQRETTPYTLALHDNMDIQLGAGAYINGNGVVSSDTASCYTKAIPVKEGDVISLTVTGRATTSVFNKRIHAYSADDGTIAVGQKGSWVSQLGYITFPIGQTNYTTQTLSVTIPSGINYIRLSHALRTGDDVILETQCDITITRPYEVGTYIQTLKTSTVQTTGYMINLGIEPKDGIGYHIKTSTNVNSSNYVFGARKETSIPSQQSNKPILVGLTGSQTGGTILSSVMGASATWASDGTNWVRPTSSTSTYIYECSLQTYKENNELKFNAIGYNYTLAKNADKQTLTYTDAIDNADEADMSTLHIGGLNANNILNGNNAFFFIECRQLNTDMTLLPVVNNNQFYFIDNKTKQTYQFYKVGSPTPATDNIRIKKLDGTFIDGTL